MTPNAKGIIGAIKAGQAFLDLDDATYRQMLASLTGGKTSCTACSLEELQRIREYLHQQGFPRSSARHGRRPKVALTKETILAKIEALLVEAKRPWAYAEGLAAQMFKQHVLEWLTEEQLASVMKALIIDAKRHGRGRK
ncbi:gp16 family protein [Serratia fonticola]|uniref:gp16 family protein n=1 Tax=Serratia fonticola TaxID=47917 RepID=UPI001648E42E|nr:regulatory protein GemA [Serratia fonticola]MBC3228336.1 regulatory protein GemA [Serratia fonticola]